MKISSALKNRFNATPSTGNIFKIKPFSSYFFSWSVGKTNCPSVTALPGEGEGGYPAWLSFCPSSFPLLSRSSSSTVLVFLIGFLNVLSSLAKILASVCQWEWCRHNVVMMTITPLRPGCKFSEQNIVS